ncbi:MAG: thioredoxin family protein [Candidatus Hadarchaeaceae archaeon]
MHELFDRAKMEDKPVLLDFTAEWCSTCMLVDEIIEKRIMPKYKDKIILAKLDVNEHIDLAKKLGIFSVPTLILYKLNGEETWRKVGAVEGEEIERNIERMLREEGRRT